MNMNHLVEQLDTLLEYVHKIPALCEPLCDPLYGYVPSDDEDEKSLYADTLPRPIIIDSGTGSTKIGFAGNDMPSLLVPNLICRKSQNSIGCFIGDDAIDYVGRGYHMSNPVQRGVVTNYRDIRELWLFALEKMSANPRKRAVVVTESPLCGESSRNQILEVLFEGLGVSHAMIVSEPLMALHASGRTTGVVLDVGDELAYAVPVVDDVIQRHAVTSISLGGRDLTDYLIQLLQQKFSLTFQNEKRSVEQMKKIFGYVAANITWERDLYQEIPEEDSYLMTDGETVKIGPERFECAEALFEPFIIGKRCGGVQQLVHDAVKKCSLDVQANLWKNVVLTGGTTTMDGFAPRLQNEIGLLVGKKVDVHVVSPSERQFGVWFGASMLAARHVNVKDAFWVSAREYFRSGNETTLLQKLLV